MKTLLKAFSAIALTGVLAMPVLADDTTAPAAPAAAPAADQKDLKKVIEDQGKALQDLGFNYVQTAQKGITLSGYVDTSYTEQFAGSGEYGPSGTNPGGGPSNTHANLRQFDTSNNTFNINAVKIALEKALPDKNDWAAGFRIDTIYGEDAKYLSDSAINGTGGNTSGLALEQALVKFRVPVGNGLDIYAGKFVTFLGYEVIESPANLNFSRGLLFTNAIPLTNTGVYADYKFNDTFEAKLGIVDGWNNSTSGSVSTTFSSANENSFGKAITGQLNINAPGNNANICQSFIYSPEGEPGAVGIDNGPVVVYDIWGNWTPKFATGDPKSGVSDPLLLGFNIDLGYAGASGEPGGETTPGPLLATTTTDAVNDSTTWYGAALYAQYKFTKVFSLSGRAEYLHEDAALDPKFGPDGTPGTVTSFFGRTIGTTRTVDTGAQDDFSYTLTASFNIWDNLLTRAEYRIDDLCAATTGSKSAVQQEASLEAVYSF